MSLIIPKTTDLYDDYQRKKEINKQKMRSIFDKTPYLTNQEGLDKAYVSPKYVYQNGYIGGTQTARDIWDDLKIPFNKVDQSQRYKDASKIIEQNIVEKPNNKYRCAFIRCVGRLKVSRQIP